MDTSNLRFDENGLIPAIVQDADTGQVLTLAYMNAESLAITLEKRLTCFFSRSRQTLWLKGETSGNYQHVVSCTADCDGDALLVRVHPDGPACHLGTPSCFSDPILPEEDPPFTLAGLLELIRGRQREKQEGSYTSYLFDKGLDKILKKLGEEATEIVIAAKNPDPEEIKYEIGDFLYHMMVLMAEKGLSWDDITDELAKR